MLKTAAFGYDGKGQVRDRAATTIAQRRGTALGRQEAILEAFIDLDREISVIGARGVDGDVVALRADSRTRTRITSSTCRSRRPTCRRTIARAGRRHRRARVMDALDYVGVLCVEFFVTRDGRLLVNELAPRPHNSGHLTFDACRTSQFEQQVRAICGLPLGSPELLQPAAMANLLGDLWAGRRARLGGGARVSRRQAAPVRQGGRRGPAGRWDTSPRWRRRRRRRDGGWLKRVTR